MVLVYLVCFFFFFFNDTATTEIYTLSLHDALPISQALAHPRPDRPGAATGDRPRDRKSTRLNSSHSQSSYAVFCLKKKKNPTIAHRRIDRKTERAPTIAHCVRK